LNARHAYVRGRVQGVAFRYYARREARRLGVDGWVRNLADGRVEVWFEGPAAALAAFEAWLAEGPPAARVDALEVERVEPRGAGGFEVRA